VTDLPPSPASSTNAGAAPSRITGAELAVQSAVPAAEIAELVARGLISGPAADGSYDRGNVSRIRLIKALEKSGIDVATLAAAAERGLGFDFAGAIVAEPVGLTPVTVREAALQCGIDNTAFREVMLAVGVAAPGPGDPIREDDLELINMLAAVTRYGVPREAILRTLRSFAISMRAIAEAQRDLFRRQVEESALSRGMPYHEMFATTAAARIPLQRIAFRTTFLLHRRLLEQLVYENLVSRFEEALEENGLTRARRASSQAICFVDLSGFTARTEDRGDVEAAAVAATFIEIAQTEAAAHRGNLVKPLGDGSMLRFARADDAVQGALAVLAVTRQRALPPARAGVAMGPLIMQDGDYYGRTVNRASRLLGVAAPDQVLVTAEVAESVRDERQQFTRIGPVQLKGLAEDIEAFPAAIA
jgi:class 3 adenylate cyclase